MVKGEEKTTVTDQPSSTRGGEHKEALRMSTFHLPIQPCSCAARL